MEASSLVMGSSNPCFSKGKDAGIHAFPHKKPCLIMGRSRKQLDFGFYDKGQLEFYDCNRIRCGGGDGKREKVKEKKGKEEKKMMKKSLKLLKGLSTDLSIFSKVVGVGLDDDRVKDETMSQAAELLLGHLLKARAEKKELKKKKKKKEEKKALSKAARMENTRLGCDMSSSSSSESSDSECDREVVSMSRLKSSSAVAQPISSVTTPVIEKETVNNHISTIPCTLDQQANTSMVKGNDQVRVSTSVVAQECCSKTNICCNDVSSSNVTTIVSSNNVENRVVTGLSPAKIEVCMGGKCKKSGAASLLEEFQKMVGVDVAVSGCKCMGKCKDGPNVKVVNNKTIDMFASDVRTPSNPLCIGVGLEDVGLIVSNFFGENPNEFGYPAAATVGGAAP